MNSNKLKYELNDQTLNFDFDEWVALNKEDPEAFEKRRMEWCRQLINTAPSSCQRRLNGLFFQINMEKQRSSNAMDSCLRLSKLMWEKFHDLRDELQGLMSLPSEPTQNSPVHKNADIIEFNRYPAKQPLVKTQGS